MTDDDAREYGAKILAMASTYGELAAFVRHALAAMADRGALMGAIANQPHPWPQSVIAARDAARRHMEGK